MTTNASETMNVTRTAATARPRISVTTLIPYTVALAVIVIVYGLQSYNIGFENGHHGWPSVHGLAIFSHVSPETRFVGHAQVFVNADGTLSYDYFDRYPLFFGAFMRVFFTFTDDLPTEIMIFRYVMNTVFLLTMFAGYRLVRLFVDDVLLALGITVTVFSSFYVVYYKDMIHYDQPALLGMLWLLVAIGRYTLGRGARWHVYAVALAAVAMGRGYASLFVLGVWFLAESAPILLGRGAVGVGAKSISPLHGEQKDVTSIPARAAQIFRTDAFRVTVLATVWATALLGYNLTAELSLRAAGGDTTAQLADTSIFNSARRRLPFFNNALDGTETLSESGLEGWAGFALVQFQRTVLWFAPLRLGGEMHWRYNPFEYDVEFSVGRTAVAVALYAVVIVFIARQRDAARRTLAIVAAFGGLAWVFFMINLSAKHIYVSMYSLGLTLVAWVALLGWLRGRVLLTRVLLVLSMTLFIGANWQARQTLNQQSGTLDDYTWDFNRITQAMPTEHGTVHMAYGYYRPWCIINNNQCYVLGYYLSDYLLTRHYELADYVLAPRPFHVAPQYAQAGETVDLLLPLNPENTVTYMMDKNAAQPRSAPADDAALFTFGAGADNAMTLADWSFVGDVNVPACGRVSVESWWQANVATEDNLNMQIVMVDADGGEVTDSNAPLGLSPTSLWQAGAFSLDVRPLTVPCDTPPGEYPLIMGVYDPDTLAPLPATAADGNPVGNQVYLTTLFVQ